MLTDIFMMADFLRIYAQIVTAAIYPVQLLGLTHIFAN